MLLHHAAGHKLLTAAAGMIVSLFFAGVLCAAEGDIRILRTDASGMTVEFVPRYMAPSPVAIGGATYQHYDFGGSVPAVGRIAGSPELPVRSAAIALAGTRGNSVEAVTTEFEELTGVLLAPLAGAVEQDGEPVARYAADAAAYAKNDFLPAELCALGRVAETQGSVLADLEFAPMQYNAARQILRRYTRIIVRVNFGPAERVSGGAMPKGSVLNDAGTQRQILVRTRSAALASSVLASGPWFRFTVTEEGIYKFTGQALLDAGIPAGTDPRTIRIYGNGGYETPMDVTAPAADDLIENAVSVSDAGTPGSLDPADMILFFGKSTRGWTYRPGTRSFAHYLNHFTETNVYWLTYGAAPAKLMTLVPSAADPAPVVPTSVIDRVSREDEKTNLLSSGLEWQGQSFNGGDQITLVHPLPGLDPSFPVRYRIHLGSQSNSSSTFTVTEHGAPVGSLGLGSTRVGDYFTYQFVNNILDRTIATSINDQQSQLRFSYNTPSATGKGFLDWLEIIYRRNLVAQADVFRFRAGDTSATTEYGVRGFSGGTVRIFDVSRFDSVVEVTPARISGDTCVFQTPGMPGSAEDFLLVGAGGFKTPGALSAVANQDLHGDPTEAENIIISHPDFLPAALRLKAHRERAGGDFLRTVVVTTDQIYNEFGGGVPSPSAIRNYLRYRYGNQSVPPRYAVLVGDGDYDYKRVIARSPNFVPPWETEESFDPLKTYAPEDDFVIFNTADRVNLGLGRLTCRSLAEANNIVDKIIGYELAPAKDPWKLRVTFVADDGLAGPGENNGFTHVFHAEAVAGHVPPLFEQRKIYLYSYPTVISAGGRRKPAVNEAIHVQVNEGTAVLNYSGHGNPRLWAHENVFVRETDFPFLHNANKYFYLVAATCNFSEFDALNDQSGGEQLLSMPGAGAIGVFSATRVVFAYENLALNEAYFSNMFRLSADGAVISQRIGDALYATKQTRTSNNDRKYFLLGDPATVMAFPRLSATVDSINGVPSSQVAQLKALSHATVNATVRDSAGAAPRPYNGQAQIVVYDAAQTAQIVNESGGRLSYPIDGNILFRGDQSVVNGAISASFVVPKDISYGNNLGRIVSYFSNAQEDGAGYTTNVRIGGTDSLASADATGPGIALFLDSKSFRPGDLVGGSPLLIAELSDSNGINTSGAGIGHRLEAWLDGNPESIDLTNYYTSKKDTYRQGTVEYRLSSLAEGTHRLRMRAWDTYNNSSMEETVFDVGTSTGLRLTNVLNYPNPFTRSTLFTFEQNQVSGIDAEVRIYTVAGRLIQTLSTANAAEERIQIPWDGRDRDGDELANGVYLYKVTARTHDGRYTSEVLGKLSILK